MMLDQNQAADYFAGREDFYWQWIDDGRVVTWSDNTTIAFREELLMVLERIAPLGLPPLGSILLLLASCRDSWHAEMLGRKILEDHWAGMNRGGDTASHYQTLFKDVLGGLDKVHASRHLVQGKNESTAELAAWLIEGAPGRYGEVVSQSLVRRLKLGLAPHELAGNETSPFNSLVHDLGCLRWGLGRFTEQALVHRLETGLETSLLPAPVKSPPPTTARDLISSLQDDPELGAVARLASLLLAALNLPRALSDPDQLPVGGVSDISNRGSLDRLLLSELAHEDLTLSVRLAMNEALFLRRESPPRTPPRRRRILLDAGLRTWGVPRIFVTAVGLALAAKEDSHISVQTFRAEQERAVPIQLESSTGLRAHLGVLDHKLHPARSVQALLEMEDPAEIETDLVLVTTDDTLSDAEFQRELQSLKIQPLYIAAVSRSGKFELVQRTSRGSKVMSRAEFNLDEVLAPRPGAPPLHEPREFLPAFFSQSKVPLRLSCPVDPQRSWLVHPGMVVTYTRDGRLLLWSNPGRGAETIAERLPLGDLQWCCSFLDAGCLRLVIGKKSKDGMIAVTYSPSTGELDSVRLQLDIAQPLELVGRHGHALVFGREEVEVVSLATGRRLCGGTTASIMGRPVPSYRQGRFFARGTGKAYREWMALAYNPAAAPELGVVCENLFQETAATQLIAVSEKDWGTGPLGLTAKGELLDPVQGAIPLKSALGKRQRSSFGLIGLSRDGRRAIVSCFAGEQGTSAIHEVLWDLDRHQMRELGYIIKGSTGNPRGGQSILEAPINEIARPRPLHTKYKALAVTDQNQLVLVSRKGQFWPLEFPAFAKELRLPRQPHLNDKNLRIRAKESFETVGHFDGGYPLELAKFADGSLAWLDGRGLLHLRSSRRELPECTLVLADGPMAGWLSDGRVFGPEFWRGEKAELSALQVQVEMLLPFAKELA